MATSKNFPLPQEKTISSGNTIIGVIPELCLVSHFQVENWAVLYRANETGNVKRRGIPLMIPNFGRLKEGLFQEKQTNLPMHGFGRNLPWSTVSHDTEHITIQLRSNEQTRPLYPYEFLFTVEVAVAQATLTYVLTMENQGNEIMPIAPGLHPYFNIAQQDKSRLSIDGLPGFNPASVAWDTQPPDNHYPFPHQVSVNFPNQGRLTIAEQPDAGHYTLADMQVWSEPASAADHAFVCFEPIVTYEDGINRPADRLEIAPHASKKITVIFTAHPS